jgi:endonuclease/exonuclease/phosphatase family metal-dependent hydrolase
MKRHPTEHGPRHRPWSAGFVVLGLLVLFAGPATGAGGDTGGKRDLTIYTQNLYVGTEFYDVLAAEDEYELAVAAHEAYVAILASDPAARMHRVAGEIEALKPDIVALQEATYLHAAYADMTTDYLALLLAELDGHYDMVVVANEFGVELPTFDPETGDMDYVQLLDREAILVRTDLPPGHLKVSDAGSGSFATNLPVFGGALEVTRGWCSVDVFVRGRRFRVVDTHLEEELFPEVRDAQAAELLAGPAGTDLPLFVCGDCNSDPNDGDVSGTYDLLVAGGLQDPWPEVNGTDPGLTWGHDPALADESVEFIWRIDLILYRGPRIEPQASDVHDLALDASGPPLWASDHAGLITTFRLR